MNQKLIAWSSLVLALCLVSPAAAGNRPRTAPFEDLWLLLDQARTYRSGFVERTGDSRDRVQNGIGFDDMRVNFEKTDLVGGPPGQSPREALLWLIGRLPDGTVANPRTGFAAMLEMGGAIAFREEAGQGYREALGDYIAGEVLLANKTLLQGLRTRFPLMGDPPEQTELQYLNASVDSFLAALQVAAGEARRHPESLRASDIVNPQFPYFVENTPVAPTGQGELVEAEYYRLTNLLNRYGIARNALAKRKFFYGNDDAASRADAAADFKASAQALYLGSAFLAAAQSEDEFQHNYGGELDRQITTAQQIFDDIQSGFNPLTLIGDFVPAQSTNGIFDLLEVQLRNAKNAECAAVREARQYDEDETALVTELRNQTESYLDQIDILLGFQPPFPRLTDSSCDPPDQLNCRFEEPEDREALLDIARDDHVNAAGEPDIAKNARSIEYLKSCDATICNNYRAWEASNIEFEAAVQAQQAIVDQMAIEEERAGEVTRIIGEGANAVGAWEIASGIAQAIAPDIGSDGVFTFSTSAAIAGSFDRSITLQEALTEIQLEETESAATYKNLLLEQLAQEISKRRAALAVVEARAEYTASIGDLVRFLRNYDQAQDELAEAYFTNPAYQVTLDRAAQQAERTFESAMVSAYKATKALEYEWAERLQNPVLDPNGVDRPIGDAALFEPIVSAESAFAVRSAGTGGSVEPSLNTYVLALQAWDATMREVRGPLRQEGQSRVILLKKDVLGFDSPDEAFNRIAFRSHLAARRTPGLNPAKPDLQLDFPIQIFDQAIFPAVPNLKIQDLRLDLRAVPGRQLLDPPSPNPPLVNVIHDDQALIRTFFADFPEDDDFLSLELEGSRSFRQSQFFAQVEATLDGTGSAAPNTQLARRSPAVSRWILRFEMDNGVNRDLLIENLDDIWIRVTYAFGQPEEFDFPDILAACN